jgi:hypothetical protein
MYKHDTGLFTKLITCIAMLNSKYLILIRFVYLGRIKIKSNDKII